MKVSIRPTIDIADTIIPAVTADYHSNHTAFRYNV